MGPYDAELDAEPDSRVFLTKAMSTFVTWAADHPAYSQLMFWRPIPHWEPAPDAYLVATEILERMTTSLRTLQGRGVIRPDADLDEATDVWTVLVSGLISQHLANEPNTPAELGRFPALIDPLVAMFLEHYA